MMKIRIATYNVNNLFQRPRPMNLKDWAQGKPILEDVSLLNQLLAQETYDVSTKKQIKEILKRNHLNSAKRSTWNFSINQVREKLYSLQTKTNDIKVVAEGRSSWIGWVELPKDTLENEAINNLARVIGEVNADILCLVEVEDRVTLDRFNEEVLVGRKFLTDPSRYYGHSMLIDGNDDRGIDVAILSSFEIRSVCPHVDDTYVAGHQKYRIFSRDCPEYQVILPNGKSIWVLINHLKSKGYGSLESGNAKRRKQAEQIKKIIASRYDLSKDYVVVAGDMNDTPASAALKPLLQTPNLYDVLNKLPAGEERWTYSAGKHQIDYLLVSLPLWQALGEVRIERRGIYKKGALGKRYSSFETVTGLTTQASDHAAIWADFTLIE